MGDPVKAEKIAKHYAAPVSAALKATPFGKRRVPAAPAVKFDQSVAVAAHTYGNSSNLFLLRSVAIDGSKTFKPAEGLGTNPVEGSLATSHGHMGTIYFPKGSCPGAINCGVLPGPDPECMADIAALLDAIVERMASEFMSSPLGFVQDINKGANSVYDKLADKGKGILDGAKKLYQGAVDATSRGIEYVATKSPGEVWKDVQGAHQSAVTWTADRFEDIAGLNKLSYEEIKKICKDWLKEMLAELKCEARDLLAEMAANPKPMAEQLGEMQASLKIAAGEAAAAAVLDVFVTKGAASAATKVGQIVGKVGPKLKGLADKFKEAIQRKREGKDGAPATKPDAKAETPPPAATPGKDSVEGQPNGNAKIGCQSCPIVATPVNPIYGTKILEGETELDFVLDGPLPLAWQRSYVSGNADTGWLGQGWSLPIAFRLDVEDDAIVFVDMQGRRTRFPQIAIGERFFSEYEHTTLQRSGRNDYEIISPDGLRLVFGPVGPHLARVAKQAQREARQAAQEAKRQARLAADPDAAKEAMPNGDQEVGQNASPDRRPPQTDVLMLCRMVDPNDNTIQVAWSVDALPHHLIDSTGRKIGFYFQGKRLAQIFDMHGKPAKDGSYPPSQLELIVQYTYSAQGDLIAVSDRSGNTVRTFAWQQHMMVEHAVPGGLVSRYEWDQTSPKGRVKRNTLKTGEFWDFVYDDIAKQTIVTDVGGRRTVYHFDDKKRFTGLTDAAGGHTARQLDAYGNLIALTDPADRTTRYTYDPQGNLIRIDAPDGSTTALAYHPDWRKPISITDALGQTTQFDYDARGNLIEQTGPDGATTQYRLNARGLPTAIVDARGGVVTLDYDDAQRLTGTTDCSGNRTWYEYDHRHNLATVTDAAGWRTEYRYETINRQDRVVHIKHPDGAEERFGYDPLGRLIAHHDPAGQVTHYTLDTHGRPIERRNALGHSLRYEHDLHGRLSALINESGAKTRFAYDILDRLVAEQGFDGLRTDYRYDTAGHLIESLQGVPAGAPLYSMGRTVVRTRYARDAMGRLLEKTAVKPSLHGVPQVSRSRYAYDGIGQLVQARNRHARIDLHYTAGGQLLREVTRTRQQHSSTLAHQYDSLGNRIATTLPDGRVLNHLTYGSGHVHQINLDGQVISDIERDKLHRERHRTQGALSSRYERDGLGRLLGSQAGMTGQVDPFAGLGGTSPQSSQSPQSPQSPNPSGAKIARRYDYDKLGQLLQIDDARRGPVRYRYDPLGRLLAAQRRGQTQEDFAFDPAHNLADAANGKDDPRNKKAKTNYSQEEWAALVKANIGNPKFNPLQATGWSPQDPASWGEYKPNHLLVWQEHRYRYDAWGNCIEKKSGAHTQQHYEWDAEHQLAEATVTSHGKTETWAYDYDPFGRRIAKYRIQAGKMQRGGKPQPQPDSLVRFVWDGNRVLLEQHRQPERQMLYVYEPGSFIPLALVRSKQPAEPLEPDPPFALPLEWLTIRDRYPEQWKKVEAMQRKTASQLGVPVESIQHPLFRDRKKTEPVTEAEVFYYHTDHLGTPQELTDEQGQIVWSADYKAWGRVEKIEQPPRIVRQVVGNTVREILEEQAEPVVQNLRYQGQQFDAETGLHYNRFRYYDPDCGRFTSHDPIGLAGGINTYVYAFNPVVLIDPLGLSSAALDKALGGKVGDCHQAHHLIPEEVMGDKRYKAMFDKLKSMGFNPDGAGNGMHLPSNEALAKQTNLPGHWSNHNDYTTGIDSQVGSLYKDWRAGKVSDTQLALGVKDIQNRAKHDIETGKVRISITCRLM